MSSSIIFEDAFLNPIDSISFMPPDYKVKIPVNNTANLFIKAQLNEKEVFTFNDKRISIRDLINQIPDLNQ